MFSLIKRDVSMRLYYGKYAIMTQLVIFICLVIFFVTGYSLQGFGLQTDWISIKKIWDGFSYTDLEVFKENSSFNIPYLWLIFNLIFFLSLRTFFVTDLTNSSGVIIIRVGPRKFVLSKAISLFIYTAIYVLILYLFIVVISLVQYYFFDATPAIFFHWKIALIFYLILVSTLFIEALIFEVVTVFLNEILAYIIVFIINFSSIFSENIFLITNYTMFSRWNEAVMLKDNILLLSLFLLTLLVILLLIEIAVVKKMDLINEKGER